jgi:hypothetical protein
VIVAFKFLRPFRLAKYQVQGNERRSALSAPPTFIMASEFIGYTILVTLNGPPRLQQLRGIVSNVIEQRLVLKDGASIRRSVCPN